MAIHYTAAEHGVLIKKIVHQKSLRPSDITKSSVCLELYHATVHSLNLHISSKNHKKCGENIYTKPLHCTKSLVKDHNNIKSPGVNVAEWHAMINAIQFCCKPNGAILANCIHTFLGHVNKRILCTKMPVAAK